MRPLRLCFAFLLALAPLAAQEWWDWTLLAPENHLRQRVAFEGPSSEDGVYRWQVQFENTSSLFWVRMRFKLEGATRGPLPALIPPGERFTASVEATTPMRSIGISLYDHCLLPTREAVALCDPALRRDTSSFTVSALLASLTQALRDEPEGQRKLSEFLASGVGDLLPRDPAASRRFLDAAVQQGDVEAQVLLAQNYAFATPPDPATALTWYQKAADQGHAEAIRAMRDRTCLGIGTRKGGAEALKWVRKTLALGDLSSVVWLARLRADGQGVARTEWEAALAKLQQPGTEAALEAEFYLAQLQDEGLEMPPNETQAMRHFLATADQGFSRALTLVAQRLVAGRSGLPRNPVLAWALLGLTGEDLLDEFQDFTQKLKDQLTPAELTRAEALTASFRANLERTHRLGLKAHLAPPKK